MLQYAYTNYYISLTGFCMYDSQVGCHPLGCCPGLLPIVASGCNYTNTAQIAHSFLQDKQFIYDARYYHPHTYTITKTHHFSCQSKSLWIRLNYIFIKLHALQTRQLVHIALTFLVIALRMHCWLPIHRPMQRQSPESQSIPLSDNFYGAVHYERTDNQWPSRLRKISSITLKSFYKQEEEKGSSADIMFSPTTELKQLQKFNKLLSS